MATASHLRRSGRAGSRARIGPLVEPPRRAVTGFTGEVLRAASALGSEFDGQIVQAAEGCSAAALSRALDEAESADLVVATAAKRWRFAHPLFGEAIYDGLCTAGDDSARAQHLRIAEALEQLRSADAFALARHFTRALPVVSAARILPFVRAAAHEAWRRSAFADAELLFRESIIVDEEAGWAVASGFNWPRRRPPPPRTNSSASSLGQAAQLAARAELRHLAIAASAFESAVPARADPGSSGLAAHRARPSAR
jgi:hypothetical protein